MPHLLVREPGRVASTVAVADGWSLGRDPENSLVVTDRGVSRRHLALREQNGGWVVADLGSRHGTFVNCARVTEQRLRDGDTIQAGNLDLVFRDLPLPDPGVVYSVTAMPEPRPRGGDQDGRRLQLLFDVSRAIGALGDRDELLVRLLEGVLEVLGAERGVIVAGERGGRRLARGDRADELVLGGPLLDAMTTRRESILVRAANGQPPGMGTPLLSAGRAGGYLYVSRAAPFSSSELDYLTALGHLAGAALDQAGEQQRLRAVAEALTEGQAAAPSMLGDSEPMRKLRARLEKFAPADASVLIRGESGTGKELVARSLHVLSRRADQPFVAVNCAAIPEALIESELFGHEKGAFTGAARRRLGKFALAHRGTLFLDEIGDLSLAAQAKVLRAIEEGEIDPVGGEGPVAVDVRLVSATHKILEDEVAAGRFRADLFYRLNVAAVVVPPLRDRGDDVLLLAETFLARAAARAGRPVPPFSPQALDALRRHSWPGNVRELANEVERALLLTEGDRVEADDLRLHVAVHDSAGVSIATAERRAIEKALEESRGNVKLAARNLGISRGTLYRKIEKYKLDPD